MNAEGQPLNPEGKVVQVAGFDHPFRNFAACYFEAMSGMTTTGASVLGTAPHDIESLPAGLLLWRSLIQWLGGLGIVVLFVAVLPLLGVGGKTLVQFETTGPVKQGVKPRISDAARELWIIYLGLTAACCVLLMWPGGMNLFDAVNHTFTAMATGGFSHPQRQRRRVRQRAGRPDPRAVHAARRRELQALPPGDPPPLADRLEGRRAADVPRHRRRRRRWSSPPASSAPRPR